MAALLPCSRREFIRKCRNLGYGGPYAGGRHQFMEKKGAAVVRVPNPHQGDISIGLLKRILKIAGINEADWIVA